MTSIICVVIGDSNVGKTSLLTRYTLNKFSNDFHPTVFIDHFENKHKHMGYDSNIGLWDTPGQEGLNGLKPFSNLEIDVFIICYSIMCPDSYENASWFWAEFIKDSYPEAGVILVGTMQDLIGDLTELSKLEAVRKYPKTFKNGKELALKIGAMEYLECSALTGIGVEEVFKAAARSVFKKRDDPSKSNCVIS